MVWAGWWMVLAGGLAATASSNVPLPLERDAFGRVTVAVKLGDSGPFRFLIDTGASLSSIAPRVARRLDLSAAGRIRATSAGNDGTLALVRARAIELGWRRLRVPWLVVLPDDRDHPLASFDGILGQDVLRQLDYLVDVRRGELWLSPPSALLATYPFTRLDDVSRAGPLTFARSSVERWVIDSGASHVVLFAGERGAEAPPPQPRCVEAGLPPRGLRADARALLVTTIGSRPARWTEAGALDLGSACVRWTSAVAAEAGPRAERGLLPLWLFDALYVDRRGTALVVPAPPQRRDPDVAAGFGALEGNRRVAGRPRRIPDIAADHAEARQLLDRAGCRRD
jgi:predicted aspartyl protease